MSDRIRAPLAAVPRAAAEQFLDAIALEPEDDNRRLRFADWLTDRGDAGAEALAGLFRLGCRVAALKTGRSLPTADAAELVQARTDLHFLARRVVPEVYWSRHGLTRVARTRRGLVDWTSRGALDAGFDRTGATAPHPDAWYWRTGAHVSLSNKWGPHPTAPGLRDVVRWLRRPEFSRLHGLSLDSPGYAASVAAELRDGAPPAWARFLRLLSGVSTNTTGRDDYLAVLTALLAAGCRPARLVLALPAPTADAAAWYTHPGLAGLAELQPHWRHLRYPNGPDAAVAMVPFLCQSSIPAETRRHTLFNLRWHAGWGIKAAVDSLGAGAHQTARDMFRLPRGYDQFCAALLASRPAFAALFPAVLPKEVTRVPTYPAARHPDADPGPGPERLELGLR